MDFDDIVKIVDQVKALEARLAAVEAEREKYQGLANNRLNCMALYRDLIGKHEARIGVLADKLNLAEAERDAARAEVERLREDEARNRWCEEKKADVNYGFHSGGVYVHEWFVQWDGIGTVHYVRHSDRNAAIDAAMRGGK